MNGNSGQLSRYDPVSGNWQTRALPGAENWRDIGCPYEIGLDRLNGGPEDVLEVVGIFDSPRRTSWGRHGSITSERAGSRPSPPWTDKGDERQPGRSDEPTDWKCWN